MNEYEAVKATPYVGYVFLIVIALYLFIIAVGFAQYIMQAIALNEIGKKRGVNNPWLAWIPIVGFADWVLGSIVDGYEAERGIKRKWKAVLVTMVIVTTALMIIGYIMYIAGIVILAAMREYYYETAVAIPMAVCVLGVVVLIAASVASITYAASKSICMFKLFESIVPEKALKYFLLSFLVPLAYPICLMKCRDKCGLCVQNEMAEPITEKLFGEDDNNDGIAE